MSAPDIQYEGPLVIKKGGKYSGNYKSTDSKIPAVWVWTSEPVEVSDCVIACAGNGIHYEAGGQLNVHHNKIYGITPSGSEMKGRGVYSYQPASVIVESNYIEQTGGGVFIDQGPSTSKVSIRFNVLFNMDKRKADLSEGPEHRAGIQLSSVRKLKDSEIAWNEITNEAGNSYIEDCVNILNSGGVKESPLQVHDNYIFGAYPYPINLDHFTGSGITVDGNPSNNTPDTMSAYVNAFRNQVISTCNAGTNIAAGHDIHFYENTVISSGMFPNGVYSERFWGGMCIWDASNVGDANFINNDQKNNTVGFYRKGINAGGTDRQDWVVVDASKAYAIKESDNIHIPNPITLQTEKDQYPIWTKKLADNKITLGPVSTVTPNKPNLSLKLGQKANGKVTPKNAKGEAVTYQADSLKVVSSDDAIAAMKIEAGAVIITPVKIGSISGTVSFMSNGGKLISKLFTMEVLASDNTTPTVDNEAVDFDLIFSIL